MSDQPKPTSEKLDSALRSLRDYHDEPRPYEGNPTTDECHYKRHNAHALPHAYFVWLGDKPLAGPMQENAAKTSCDAINASLAAERRAAEVKWNEAVAVRDINHLNRIQELEKQLATEKEKAQHSERELRRSVAVEGELIKQLAAEREEHGRIAANLAMQVQEITHQLTTVRELREFDQKALAVERRTTEQQAEIITGLHQQLNAEREKADNLFKVSRKHCVENQELKKQLAAEHTNAEAWRLVAEGKEGAYVKMMQVSEVAANEWARENKEQQIAKITQEVLRSVPAALKQEIEQLCQEKSTLVNALKESNQMLVACSESSQILKRVDRSGGWQKAEKGILDLIQRNTDALEKVKS